MWRKNGVNWTIPPKRVVRKALFSTRICSRRCEHPVHAATVRGHYRNNYQVNRETRGQARGDECANNNVVINWTMCLITYSITTLTL